MRPVGITGWALRALIFLAFAGVITVFQIDRHSRDRAALMAFVPAGLGGFADAALARPLAMMNPDNAVVRAEAALRHRPIDATSLASYALAKVEAGDEEGASQALSLAAQRGWRDTYTQIMVIGSALTGERWDVAAQRVDALARLRREEEAINGTLSLIMREEAAQRALAKRMVISEPLMNAVAGFVTSYPIFGPEVSQTILYAAADGDIDCGQLARVTRALLANEMSEEVRKIWPERCSQSQGAGLAFSMASSELDPFAWAFPAEGGVDARAGSTPDAIDVRNRDPLRRRFAYRYTQLDPGEHTITLDRAEQAARPGIASSMQADVIVTLRCITANEDLRRPLVSQVYEGPIRFALPDECMTQYVSLTLGQGRVTDLTISVD